MNRKFRLGCAAAWALATVSVHANQAVTLMPSEGIPGSSPLLEFRLISGCPAALPTRVVSITLPFGRRLTRAVPQAGWHLTVQDAIAKNGPLGLAGSARWARPESEGAWSGVLRFTLGLRLPQGEEILPFRLREECADGRSIDSHVPLRILAPSLAPVEVSDAWMRTPPATGPRDTAAFMTFKPSQSVRLVQAFSSAARRIDFERTLQSKIRGLQMFPAPNLDLPAGSTVRLVPGDVHLAVHGLDNALGDGAEVPVTLRFEDAAGIITQRVLVVRLSSRPPSEALPTTPRK